MEAAYRSDSGVCVKNLSGDLQQLSDHAFYFNQCIGRYPFDAVFEVMLYVNPVACTADTESFDDNLLVRSVKDDASDVVRIIAEQDARLSDVVGQPTLDDLAREVLERYGDRDLRKRQMHMMRLERKSA